MLHPAGDTIVAAATPAGGAVALVRLSGPEALAICARIFRGPNPLRMEPNTIRFGRIVDPADGRIVDEVMLSVYRAPRSYTGEDAVEISCHGSRYIVSQIISLAIRQGARSAEAGEFTARAFLAGKIDLAQAEAVADMIAADSAAAHALAANQLRGIYSAELGGLRGELLRLASLLELELDFAEEDVTFADRSQLDETMTRIEARLATLCDSFSVGNAIREGVAVAIVGPPNAGKSTLLNALAGDERALVSEVAGTTRDTVEETISLAGVRFRFIDTAGLRPTDDCIEQLGIERTRRTLRTAEAVLLVHEIAPWGVEHPDPRDNAAVIAARARQIAAEGARRLIPVLNKADLVPPRYAQAVVAALAAEGFDALALSAKKGTGLDGLTARLTSLIDTSGIFEGAAVVSNSRHYEALLRARSALSTARKALGEGLPADLLSEDIRQALHYLGTVTGQITDDEILGEIFSKFCIGK